MNEEKLFLIAGQGGMLELEIPTELLSLTVRASVYSKHNGFRVTLTEDAGIARTPGAALAVVTITPAQAPVKEGDHYFLVVQLLSSGGLVEAQDDYLLTVKPNLIPTV